MRRRIAALLMVVGFTLLAAVEMPRKAPAQATDPSDPVLVGVGDIADDLPSALGDNQTAQLVQTRWPDATVFASGDLAYETGTLDQFDAYYHDSDPSTQYAWGESLGDQIKPVPGNHEYKTLNAEGYFAYFAQQGVPVGDGTTNARGYYYYDLGLHWRVIALNTGAPATVPVSSGSPQYAWLEARLKEADAAGKNVVAYFHHPLYSSGSEHGWRNSTSTNKLPCSAPSTPQVKPMWNLLHLYGADLIIQAHDHNYERFVPMDPGGTTADVNGPDALPNPILSFVVGSGGKSLRPNGDQFPLDYNGDCGPLRPQSAKFLYDKFGVLRLTLHQSSFDFEYVQTTDGTDAIVADSGMSVPVNPRDTTADTTAPTVSGVAPTEGATEVAATANAEATFSEAMDPSTISDANGASTTFTLTKQNASQPLTAQVSYDAATKKATLDPNADLDPGATYTATVKGGVIGVKDLAGNPLGADITWSFSTAAVPLPLPDITPPETTIDSGPSGTVSSNSASFAFSSNEVNSAFECRLDGATFSSCTSPKSYSDLADGSHTIEVRATDAAGNTDATPASRTWTIDSAAPDTTIDSGPSGTITVANAEFTFSSLEAGATFECRLDGAAYSACTSPKSYTNLSNGSHTFDVRATDVAGNVDATPASRTFSVEVPPPPQDTTPPNTTIDSGPSGTIKQNSATFAFSSSEANSTFECKLDGGAFSACSSPKKYGGLANGSHTFSVRATDAAGNIDLTPASRTWTVRR